MDGFLRKLISEWRCLEINPKSPLIIGVSGGADSLSLLVSLVELKSKNKIKNDIVAAHFNHNTRGNESVEEEEAVRDLAESLGIGFRSDTLGNIDGGGNLEQVWRDERYSFLRRVASDCGSDYVLTAHTMNDLAETFLLNLIRGAGVGGLSAMPSKRGLDPEQDVELVRPLLNWATRADTEEFCRSRKLKFSEDPMNDDTEFSRIRVRKELIPLLKDFNPNIIATIARTANILGDFESANGFLLEHNIEIAGMLATESLWQSELNSLPVGLRRIVVREWIRRQKGDLRRLGSDHVESIIGLAESTKSGKSVELPGKLVVAKQRGKLILRKGKVEKTHSGVYN